VKPRPYVNRDNPALNLDLSAHYGCSPANFPYPQEGSVVLGIKAVDLAGNWSEASEVTLGGVAANAREAYELGSLVDGAENPRTPIVATLLALLALLVAAAVISEESDSS